MKIRILLTAFAAALALGACGQGGGNEGRQGGEDELFHGCSRLFPQKYA